MTFLVLRGSMTMKRPVRASQSQHMRSVSKLMRILTLNVKKEYFVAIKNGTKIEEFRLVKPYWNKRLSKDFDEIHILCGYPRKDDTSKRLVFPYHGWIRKEITHKHFGSEPVKVYAIRLANKRLHGDPHRAA